MYLNVLVSRLSLEFSYFPSLLLLRALHQPQSSVLDVLSVRHLCVVYRSGSEKSC